MTYKQEILDKYRSDALSGRPFICLTCPYCNGQRDPSVKHIHPSTKPDTPWLFWNHVLGTKYWSVQSKTSQRNLRLRSCTEGVVCSRDEPHQVNNPHNFVASRKVRSPYDENLYKNNSGASKTDITMTVVGPMVDQSELPFRMLCREYGATLAYTPMLHAKSFKESATYRRKFFTTTPAQEVRRCAASSTAAKAPVLSSTQTQSLGSASEGERRHLASGLHNNERTDASFLVDRPCIVQFCGHDADVVLQAARLAVRGDHYDYNHGDETHHITSNFSDRHDSSPTKDERELYYECDAVDVNLGCPQGIARRGYYGSFLMEDWDLIHTIIHTLHVELEVPVTAKIRVFDSTNTSSEVKFDELLTIHYAQMLRDAGAQLLCVHGRTRAMKGQNTGLANLELIRRVRLALGGSIPVIANGNVLCYQDVIRNLQQTGCEGYMCAEPLLWDPKLFSNPVYPVLSGRSHGANKKTRLAALETALDYVRWLRRYPVDMSFAKAHLFKMCHHSYELHTNFRDFIAGFNTHFNGAPENGMDILVDPQVGCSVLKDNGLGRSIEVQHSEDTNAAIAQVQTLERHLQALVRAELSCNVEGEQPKVAKESKAELRMQQVDVFEDEGVDLWIDF